MEHFFYSDGNERKISWSIQTEKSIVKQERNHAEMYFNKITKLQSKFVALHVGLFWGIGVFIIKNEDRIKIFLDDHSMYDHLNNNKKIDDEFIEKKTVFIKQLILQRKLNIQYELITSEKNISKIS